METRSTNLLGTAGIESIITLNPVRDSAKGDVIVNCLALLVKTGDMWMFVHAFQDLLPDYDRFVRQCTMFFLVGANDMLPAADGRMKALGLVSAHWEWVRVDLTENDIVLDVSSLLYKEARDNEGGVDSSTLKLFHSMDTIQILGTAAMVNLILGGHL